MKKLFSVLSIALLFLFAGSEVFSQVKASGTLTVYPDFATAFTAVQAGTEGLSPTLTVVGSFVEPAGATLTKTAAFNSVRIVTAGAFTVSIPAATNVPIITFINVSNSSVDGRSGGIRALTFNHPNVTLANTSVGIFNLSNGCSNDTIRYVIGTTPTAAGRMINIAQSTAALGGNNNDVVDSCLLSGGQRGIQVFGTAGVNSNDNTILRNNIVKNTNALGIFIGSVVKNIDCTGNDLFWDAATVMAASYVGIQVQGTGVVNIVGNKMHDLAIASGAASAWRGMITLPASLAPLPNPVTTVNIINNCFTLFPTNPTGTLLLGIQTQFSAATTSIGYTANVFNNTSVIGGASGATTGPLTEAILGNVVRPIGTQTYTQTLYNNIAINRRSGGSTASFNVGLSIDSISNLTTTSDYNMCYADNGFASAYGSFAYPDGALEAYKEATCSFPIEQHTMFKDVNFAGLNDCHLGLVGGDMCGKPLSAVPTDIDGDPRNATYPYKGCDEKAGNPLKIMTVTACLEGKASGSPNSQINVILKSACVVKSTCTGDLDNVTMTSKLCYGDSTSNGLPYQLDVKSLNHLETYSSGSPSFVAGTASYNFTTSPAQAFGGNETAGPPSCFYGGDANQDSTIDLSDITLIYNAAGAFTSGCRLPTDINSDQFVDLSDLTIAFNNSSNFVSLITPCPEPTSVTISNEVITLKTKVLNTDSRNVNINADY